MANDLKQQNNNLKKQNAKLKKKNKRGGVIILVLLLVLLLLFLCEFLFDPLGIKNGMGILLNNNNSERPQISLQTEESVQQAEEATAVVVSVRVSGSTYLLNDAESDVDGIVSAAQTAGEKVTVEITDDSATANAMDALITALEGKGIAYSVV